MAKEVKEQEVKTYKAELIMMALDGFTGRIEFKDADDLYKKLSEKIGHTNWTLEYSDGDKSGLITNDKTDKIIGTIHLLDGLLFKVTEDLEGSITDMTF